MSSSRGTLASSCALGLGGAADVTIWLVPKEHKIITMILATLLSYHYYYLCCGIARFGFKLVSTFNLYSFHVFFTANQSSSSSQSHILDSENDCSSYLTLVKSRESEEEIEGPQRVSSLLPRSIFKLSPYEIEGGQGS